IEFVGVVAVQDHGHRQPGTAQCIDQLGGDPLGDNHRQAGVHPQPAYVADIGNFPGQPGQALVTGSQGGAAAVDHLGDAVVLTDIIQCLAPLGGAQVVVLVGEMPAEAVPAIDRATAADHQQQPSV